MPDCFSEKLFTTIRQHFNGCSFFGGWVIGHANGALFLFGCVQRKIKRIAFFQVCGKGAGVGKLKHLRVLFSGLLICPGSLCPISILSFQYFDGVVRANAFYLQSPFVAAGNSLLLSATTRCSSNSQCYDRCKNEFHTGKEKVSRAKMKPKFYKRGTPLKAEVPNR